MALTDDQKQWADSHINVASTLSGAVDSWSENDDGTVTFHVTFTATPPPTPEQVAASEAARAVADADALEAAQAAQVAAAAEFDERVKIAVDAALAARDVP